MIYLIDDKKNRQEFDYGWNAERLQKFKSLLIPVYTYNEIKESKTRDAIFSPGNIILFHESFFDNTINLHSKDSVDIRSELNKHATDKKIWVVFFSGSKSSRTLDDRVAHIPVSVLYNNLEAFIKTVSESSIDLRYLLFGEKNPEIEAELLNKLIVSNNKFDETPIKSNQRNLVALTGSRIGIPIILEGAIERNFNQEEKYEKEITQPYLNDKVNEWLSNDEVDNIFIPLCFGPSLSDYNGLQFACHIRCTDTVNRLKPIFLYSFVDYSYLIECEYFNILKTKNVFLIDYTRQAFVNSLFKEIKSLTITQLPKEIHKLKLDVPSNYEDSHGIANEWSIYRWAISIGSHDTEIEKITEKIDGQLYFKYLQTIYPKADIKFLSEDQLKLKYSGNPKILYIDDEADKGWYEILCTIISDHNKITEFHYLCEELKSKSREEIINLSIEKIKNNGEYFDLILLDFRLQPDDFIEHNIKNVTGLKLLKEIKKLNPGIQVVIFSATNKAWNLKMLQEAKVDGFVLKESPENSEDPNHTLHSIVGFVNTLEVSIEKIFLKDFYFNLEVLNSELVPRKNYQKSQMPLPKEFVDEILKWLNISYDLLNDELSQTNLTASFLFLFSVLENVSNRIIDVDNPIEITGKPNRYQFKFRVDKRRLRRFIEDENNPGFYRRTKTVLESNRNLPWVYKILNTLDSITNESLSEKLLSSLIKKRNDIIHANSTTGDKIEISPEILIQLNTIIYQGLKNIK